MFRYSAVLLMFHYCVVFRLFRQCSVVSPVFRCSASVPVFRQCSAGVSCSVDPCSAVPGFIVCPGNFKNVLTSKYFWIFSNKPPARWVAYINKKFCYMSFLSYYSSIIYVSNFQEDTDVIAQNEASTSYCAPPTFCWGGWTYSQIFKKWRLDKFSVFKGELPGQWWWSFSGGGCSFHIKNKLKSEIFNDKKSL